MRILLLDNYDSFTYNLFHLVEKLSDCELLVKRNDAISLQEVDDFDKIILSPGPGLPKDAGIMPALILRYYKTKSILGVCLGHQAIAEAFGAKLINLSKVYHGVARPCNLLGTDSLFKGLKSGFLVGRYHSWVVDQESLPKELQVTAVDDEGICMGLRHQEYDIRGVQFHPESILSEGGELLLKNWLEYGK